MKNSNSSKVADYQALFACFKTTDRLSPETLSSPLVWNRKNISIIVGEDNIVTYNTIIDKIFYRNKIISKRYMFDTFLREIKQFIVNLVENNLEIDCESIQGFEKKLIDADEFNDTIMMPIYGASLASKDSLRFGPFEIFDLEKSKMTRVEHVDVPNKGIFIAINDIRHSDTELAYNQALLRFHEFKYILQYMIGYRSEKYLVKFGTREQPDQDERLIYTDSIDKFLIQQGTIVGSSTENKFIEPIGMTDQSFFNEKSGNVRIWELYTDYHKGIQTKLANRIIKSIIISGKSIYSLDMSDAFIHLIIAYEILLSYDEKSLFGTSFGQKLSEAFALLLGDNLESRKSISSDIKDLYSIRSALVHGDEKKPTPLQYQRALNYLQRIIRLLLTDDKLKGFKTIEELNNHINELKFS